MKAILISIKPKWVAKILNGEKTIEVRKTMPKCELPIDVYIYCTKEDSLFKSYIRMGYYTVRSTADDLEYNGKGKVVTKFTLNKVEEIRFDDKEVQRKACLTEDELFDYLFVNEPYHEDMKKGYAWHISNLEIFDRPKELSEFYYSKEPKKELNIPKGWKQIITKAPQNFCYIEVNE